MRTLHFLTIHPEFVTAYAKFGVVRSAMAKQQVDFVAHPLRAFAYDKHGSVDDAPYGGGDGMVLRPDVLTKALASLPVHGPRRVINVSPAGKPWTDAVARSWATQDIDLVFICGRFGGVDQRFIDRHVDEEYSLGDFILSGGEIAALAMADSLLRFIPGVLGNTVSADRDSFSPHADGWLEHPLYTRPPMYEGQGVPDVLLSGDHEAIERWRQEESRRKTERLRPDLLGERSRPT